MIRKSDSPSAKFGYLRAVLQATMGALAVALGCGVILYIVAFSSMVDPRMTRPERWLAILAKMFLTPSFVPLTLGGFMMVAGLAVVVLSGWTVAHGAITKQKVLLVAVIAILVSAALLALIAMIA